MRTGEVEDGTAAAERILAMDDPKPVLFCDVACCHAIAVGQADDDAARTLESQVDLTWEAYPTFLDPDHGRV